MFLAAAISDRGLPGDTSVFGNEDPRRVASKQAIELALIFVEELDERLKE